MKIEGCERLLVDAERLWDLLSDPQQIVACVPGLVSYQISGSEISAKVKQGIGFLKGTFDAKVVIESNDRAGKTAVLKISGNSSLGTFDASTSVFVRAQDEPSICYSADVKVAGMLGTLSGAIIANSVKKMVQDFLKCAQEKLLQGNKL
ncbi:MAG: CoxG family protein [Nitrososphaeria archaeon]